MRITYDFFQRVSKLPADQLKKANALKVHLFGSLSATGKGMEPTGHPWPDLLGKVTCRMSPAIPG